MRDKARQICSEWLFGDRERAVREFVDCVETKYGWAQGVAVWVGVYLSRVDSSLADSFASVVEDAVEEGAYARGGEAPLDNVG